MFSLVDTHCHLLLHPLVDNLEAVIDRAFSRGVEKMVVPGVDIESSSRALRLAGEYPGVIYAAVGIHPQITAWRNSDIEEIRRLAHNPNTVAIGEIGLDKSEGPDMEIQEKRLLALLSIASESNLPVLIHCRGAIARLLEIITDNVRPETGGILHAWNGTPEMLNCFSNLGFFAGVAGTASRSQAHRVRASISAISLDRIVLETDSPFIATSQKPKGFVEPADTAEVCAAVSELQGLPMEIVARSTTANALRVLRLG